MKMNEFNPFNQYTQQILDSLGNYKIKIVADENYTSFDVWLERPSFGSIRVIKDFYYHKDKIDCDMSNLCTLMMEGNKQYSVLFDFMTNEQLSWDEKYSTLMDVEFIQSIERNETDEICS